MISCSICESKEFEITYNGPIRIGLGQKRTEKSYDVYKCKDCDTILHENDAYVPEEYYESTQYRVELEGTSEIQNFYDKHDKDCLNKFRYTGTDIFRNKVVADIGCGGGGWLDFLKGVALKTVAIEPSEYYRKHLKEKRHITFPYMRDAFDEFSDKIDVITSFDVIEHVSDPQEFSNDIFHLIRKGGQVIVGTPSEYRHLRELVGNDFDSFIFSIQHPWVFAVKGLSILFEKAGFKDIKIKQYTNYGLGNVFAWLKERTPKGNITYPCISETINEAWKANLAERGYGDYLVVYATK